MRIQSEWQSPVEHWLQSGPALKSSACQVLGRPTGTVVISTEQGSCGYTTFLSMDRPLKFFTIYNCKIKTPPPPRHTHTFLYIPKRKNKQSTIFHWNWEAPRVRRISPMNREKFWLLKQQQGSEWGERGKRHIYKTVLTPNYRGSPTLRPLAGICILIPLPSLWDSHILICLAPRATLPLEFLSSCLGCEATAAHSGSGLKSDHWLLR